MSSSSGRRSRSRSRLQAVEYEEVETSVKEDPDNYDVHEAQRLNSRIFTILFVLTIKRFLITPFLLLGYKIFSDIGTIFFWWHFS